MNCKVRTREIVIVSCAVIVSLLAGSVQSSQEFPITTEPHDQHFPAIYGDYVVWQDHRHGNADIYGFNLLTGEEFQITTDPKDQKNPAIYGNIVVWEDKRNRKNSIYGYDLSKRQEFQISTAPGLKSNPAIYGNIVVWEDSRDDNEGIYGYNLSTQQEFQITKGLYEQQSPAIYEDIVIWEEERDHDDIIYGLNLETHQEFHVPFGRFFFPANSQHDPAIYKDIIVWTEGLDNILYGYNLSTLQEFKIATARMKKCPGIVSYVDSEKPALYRDIVIWVDCRNKDHDIYGYNLSTGKEFVVTASKGRQQSPALCGEYVVWEDYRNGNWDIYGLHLRPPFTTVKFNYQERFVLFGIFYGILVASPVPVALLLVKKSVRKITKIDNTPKVILIPKITPQNFMRKVASELFIVPAISYGIFSVFVFAFLLLEMYFFGLLGFIATASLIIIWLSNRKVPYICVTQDEIAIFPTVPRKVRIIKWDTVQKINQQRGKNAITLLLSDNTEAKINLSLMDEKDVKKVLQILKLLPCEWTFSFPL